MHYFSNMVPNQLIELIFINEIWNNVVELVWRSGSVMDCQATARVSNPGGNGIFPELHVLCKGQEMGVPSLNDLIVDGT